MGRGTARASPQRKALFVAVRVGHYDIPPEWTPKHLADELDVSDQAVTERFRRAVGVFTRHALLTQSSTREERTVPLCIME
jgi:hypothetical protein